jgi:mannitol/fructose-specific phosphotransferase system IIA component (Ntr-type)
MIMVSKIEEKINTDEHVVLAIPPFASLEPGFNDALRNIKILVNQIGTDLKVIGVTDRIKILKGIITKMEPNVKTEFIEIPNWLKLIEKLDDLLDDKSLFVLLSAREGTISWRPGLDRLPGLIANRFQKNNFITIFPSEMDSSHVVDDFRVINCIDESAVTVVPGEVDFDELMTTMIHQKFPENTLDHEHLQRALMDNSLDYTPEIIPGVSIFDTHSPSIDETCVLIATSKQGIRVPKTSRPSNVLILVVNPDAKGTDGHFTRLNEVARVFKNAELKEKLIHATDQATVLKVLLEQSKQMNIT